MFAINKENLKKLKHIFFEKKNSFQGTSLFIAYGKCGHQNEKICKEEESIEILEGPGLINNIKEYQKIYNHV